MSKKPTFLVSANYSFWKHPLKWLKERKSRKLLEKIIEYKWNNGMKIEVEEQVENMIIYGKSKQHNKKV